MKKFTKRIKRSEAIQRICQVYLLIQESEFQTLEKESYEPDLEILDCLDYVENSRELIYMEFVTKWSNSMLQNVMDLPFFRYKHDDNYIVLDDEEYEEGVNVQPSF